jgi:transposase
MPKPLELESRERAVAAYEAGEGSFEAISARFSIHVDTLRGWVKLCRMGSIDSLDSALRIFRVDVPIMHAVVRSLPNRTVLELTRAYNERVPDERFVHRNTFLRALRRAGYTFTKSYPGPQNVQEVQNAARRAKRRRDRIRALIRRW